MKLVTAILGLFTATAIHAAPLPNPDAKSSEALKLSSRIIPPPMGGGTPCRYPVRTKKSPKVKDPESADADYIYNSLQIGGEPYRRALDPSKFCA